MLQSRPLLDQVTLLQEAQRSQLAMRVVLQELCIRKRRQPLPPVIQVLPLAASTQPYSSFTSHLSRRPDFCPSATQQSITASRQTSLGQTSSYHFHPSAKLPHGCGNAPSTAATLEFPLSALPCLLE